MTREPNLFTYPFCYVPRGEIVRATEAMIRRIGADASLHASFSEGKMIGVMMVEDADGQRDFIYSFSGNVGGKARVDGFVPPIYDLTDPAGHYKLREAEISRINADIREETSEERVKALKARRKVMSGELQDWIFDQYVVSNALGQSKTIRQVFADKGIVPPGGTGDCAAPKLLQYAYTHGLRPLAMGEFWYGVSPSREIRHQGAFYPACTGKCGPLLSFMMEGLDVEPNPLDREAEESVRTIYEDDALIVVDKPSGMLSVPGKTAQTSLQEILSRRYGKPVYSCHRLDMDTSGLMVFAKSTECQAAVQQQFETRRVRKEYTAVLCPSDIPFEGAMEGTIDLPLITDWDDRPRQMVDFEHGKRAVTDYRILGISPTGEMTVRFIPHTGRTHQLRVHAAHPLGLGRPIKGDRLYGGLDNTASRQIPLQLRATYLSFEHPSTGKAMEFRLI